MRDTSADASLVDSLMVYPDPTFINVGCFSHIPEVEGLPAFAPATTPDSGLLVLSFTLRTFSPAQFSAFPSRRA
jgi:hypothetical protein